MVGLLGAAGDVAAGGGGGGVEGGGSLWPTLRDVQWARFCVEAGLSGVSTDRVCRVSDGWDDAKSIVQGEEMAEEVQLWT